MGNRGGPTRRQVVVATCIVVGRLHFVTGPSYRGPCRAFVNWYLIDLLLPFAMVLLLSLPAGSVQLPLWGRAAGVFAFGVAVELVQSRGVELLGATADPVDVVMYGVGIAAAVLFELLVLVRLRVD